MEKFGVKKINSVYLFDVTGGCVSYNSKTGEIYIIGNLTGNDILSGIYKKLDYETVQLIDNMLADSNVQKIKTDFSMPLPIEYEQLYLIITESCNLACKYCRQYNSMENRTMTEGEVDDAIDLFISKSKNPKSMVLYGGEVMLYPHLVFRAIDRLRAVVPQIPITIITNGILCTPDIAKQLKQRKVMIVFSIDGPEKYHDTARISHDGHTSYLQAIEGYHNCQEVGCDVGISCTIGPHTAKHLNEIEEWLIDLHPISVGFGLPHGDFSNYAYQISDVAKLYKEIFQISDRLAKKGISVVHVERKVRDYYLGNINPFECHACQKRLVICPGKMYGICEGAVTDKNMFFTNLSQAKDMAKEWQKISPITLHECADCIAQRVCGGGCPYDKLLRYHSLIHLDESKCMFQKMLAEFSVKKLAQEYLNEVHHEKCIVKLEYNERLRLANALVIQKHDIPLQFNSDVSM